MIQLFDNIIKEKAENFVAINLGNRYLKGLVISAGKISDFFLIEKKNISQDIKTVWQEKKISTNKVKISVKDRLSLVRYFPFPKIDKKKLKNSLFYELNKHIPFSPEEVYFDFSILEELSANEIFLLLAVAKKELVNNAIDIFEKEKKEVLSVNLDSLCLVNVFLSYYKEERKVNNCILDIGYAFSTLTVLKKGIPFITRDLTFGTKDIFGVVSNVKNLPIQDIDKWLINEQNHKEFLDLVQDNLAGLCREVKSSFDYFEVNKGERIEKLFLTGGLASVKGIDGIFKDNLDSDVGFLDNLQSFKSIPAQEKLDKLKNSFAVACGLAL